MSTRLLATLTLATACGCSASLRGPHAEGPLPALDAREQAALAELRPIVHKLAVDIGERNLDFPDRLDAAAAYLEGELRDAGYDVARQRYTVRGRAVDNLIAERHGTTRAREVVVVGGHYDSAQGTPGADDNASGAAATVVLARWFAKKHPARTVRFVEFVNEEEPYFWTETMGSVVYARDLAERAEDVVAMLSLETMAYFSPQPGTQKYLFPLSLMYPSRGDFVAFVSDLGSDRLAFDGMKTFRARASVPAEAIALPRQVPGIGWSDHWSFWQEGYPAVMVTDTAPFRNPHYHQKTDLPDTLDWPRFARAVVGVEAVVEKLATP